MLKKHLAERNVVAEVKSSLKISINHENKELTKLFGGVWHTGTIFTRDSSMPAPLK